MTDPDEMDAFSSSVLKEESPTSGVDSLAAAVPPASMSLLIFYYYGYGDCCAKMLFAAPMIGLDGVPHLVQMHCARRASCVPIDAGRNKGGMNVFRGGAGSWHARRPPVRNMR